MEHKLELGDDDVLALMKRMSEEIEVWSLVLGLEDGATKI